MLNLSSPIAVVCHDAGATNIILSWLKANKYSNLKPVMKGPAEKLWKSYYPDLLTFESINDAIDGCDVVISGTGWESNIEHMARELAKQKSIKSIAIIDHWVNYPNRFIRKTLRVWPDKFWVSDDYAYQEAKKHFPNDKIALITNYYLQNQIAQIKKYRTVKPAELLYILEPIHKDWGRGTPAEFQSLDYLIDNIKKLKLPENFTLKLRPHPSENKKKYLGWMKENQNKYNIEVDNCPLYESIGKAKWVAGCESYALTIALNAGKKVFCTLPPWGHNCRLPQQNIYHIKDII